MHHKPWALVWLSSAAACSSAASEQRNPVVLRAAPADSATVPATRSSNFDTGEPRQTRWTTASDSVLPPPSDRGACFNDIGCPAPATPLVPCSPELRPEELGRVMENLDVRSGSHVVVRGFLRADTYDPGQLNRCEACCVPHTVPLSIGPAKESGGVLPLRSAAVPRSFQCQADASRLCCGVDVASPPGHIGHEVIAAGTVRREVRPTSSPVYFMDESKLCSLDQPVPGPPPNVRFVEDGCTVGGVQRSAAQTFESANLRCGCFDGRVECRKIDVGACFLRGGWFPNGARLGFGSTCLALECKQEEWEWDRRPCEEGPTILYFRQDSAELDGVSQELVRATADWMARSPRTFVVQARSGPGEGERSTELGRARVERVMAILAAAKVPDRRLHRVVKTKSEGAAGSNPGRVEIKIKE